MTETLLLDEFLPACDHVVSVSQVFRAPPEEVLAAAVTLDLRRLPLARVLITARGLPARLSGAVARHRGQRVARKSPPFRVRDLPAHGWVLLGEHPRAELVYGTVTQPWRALGGEPPQPMETRVAATDEDGRRRFRRYWQATGPFITLIRPSVLRALERQSLRCKAGPVSEEDRQTARTRMCSTTAPRGH
ncbi:MAG: hypothetical protein ACM3ML_06155, partial [Micromonosporaceae bacterium]